MEGKKCGAGYRNRQLPHSTHFDLSNTGVTNNINTGCLVCQCPDTVRAGLLARITGTPKWKGAIINVSHYTCVFPAMTSQNVCCKDV